MYKNNLLLRNALLIMVILSSSLNLSLKAMEGSEGNAPFEDVNYLEYTSEQIRPKGETVVVDENDAFQS